MSKRTEKGSVIFLFFTLLVRRLTDGTDTPNAANHATLGFASVSQSFPPWRAGFNTSIPLIHPYNESSTVKRELFNPAVEPSFGARFQGKEWQ